MKKYSLPLIILALLFLYKNSYSFDVTGLQPTEPYGIFSTFSAESLPKGKFAFSTGAEILMEPDFYRFILKAAYGITDNIELNMTVPYIHKWDDTVDGFEDIAFGIKHRFFDEGKYGPSLAYIITASLPSGRDEFSTDGRFGIGLIVSKRVGPVNGHVNLFYERPGTGRHNDEIALLTGLDFAAAHNFKILAELICKKSHDSNEFDSIEGRIGYRIKTTDNIYTTLGLGFDLKNNNPEYRLMLSVSFLLPYEKKKIKKVYEEE
ncbi:MAG: transporter [Nitrospira sp.]|nr:transporter [Nitrospira sp.]